MNPEPRGQVTSSSFPFNPSHFEQVNFFSCGLCSWQKWNKKIFYANPKFLSFNSNFPSHSKIMIYLFLEKLSLKNNRQRNRDEISHPYVAQASVLQLRTAGFIHISWGKHL